MPRREPGPYWVRVIDDGEWEIGGYTGGAVFLIGDETGHEVVEWGPRIEPPPEGT